MHQQASATFINAGRHSLLHRVVTSYTELLSDAELLEVLLQPLCPFPSRMAVLLLERFTTLKRIFYAEESELRNIDGVDDVILSMLMTTRALTLRMAKAEISTQPIFESSNAVIDYCQLASGYGKVEEFRILFLDHAHRLICDEVMHRGTVNHTPVYPREVVKRALEVGAGAVILVHNHPSGDVTPSSSDIELTKQIVIALASVSISMLDHVIVSPTLNTSFKTLGLI